MAWNLSTEPVDIIYLDFPKAFDKVLHKGLLKKLISHEESLAWVKKINSKVPEGAVLGLEFSVLWKRG